MFYDRLKSPLGSLRKPQQMMSQIILTGQRLTVTPNGYVSLIYDVLMDIYQEMFCLQCWSLHKWFYLEQWNWFVCLFPQRKTKVAHTPATLTTPHSAHHQILSHFRRKTLEVLEKMEIQMFRIMLWSILLLPPPMKQLQCTQVHQ